jgi:chaperonin GroEL
MEMTMNHTEVLFRSQAREKILRGVNAVADAVRVTLGPKSKCVLIERKFGAPLVCNDGVTIAKETNLKDPAENLGAQIIRQAAERTGDAVGDGTSTATILAQAIFTEGLKNVVPERARWTSSGASTAACASRWSACGPCRGR